MENDTLKSVIHKATSCNKIITHLNYLTHIIYVKPLYRLEIILNTIATVVDIVILLPTNISFVYYLLLIVKRIY